jgi:molybdopterin converting factor small subunit
MRILMFAHLRDAAGVAEISWRVTRPLGVEELWRRLLEECPALRPHRPAVRLARNWEYTAPDEVFSDADEVALIPPVSGG